MRLPANGFAADRGCGFGKLPDLLWRTTAPCVKFSFFRAMLM
jgi:hypothetical protein